MINRSVRNHVVKGFLQMQSLKHWGHIMRYYAVLKQAVVVPSSIFSVGYFQATHRNQEAAYSVDIKNLDTTYLCYKKLH